MNCERFVLFRLPMPRPGQVLGLVGTNGIGKSTALKILAGKQKPNLGRFTVSYRTPVKIIKFFYKIYSLCKNNAISKKFNFKLKF